MSGLNDLADEVTQNNLNELFEELKRQTLAELMLKYRVDIEVIDSISGRSAWKELKHSQHIASKFGMSCSKLLGLYPQWVIGLSDADRMHSTLKLLGKI